MSLLVLLFYLPLIHYHSLLSIWKVKLPHVVMETVRCRMAPGREWAGPLRCVFFPKHTKVPYGFSAHSLLYHSPGCWRPHLGNPVPPFGLYGTWLCVEESRVLLYLIKGRYAYILVASKYGKKGHGVQVTPGREDTPSAGVASGVAHFPRSALQAPVSPSLPISPPFPHHSILVPPGAAGAARAPLAWP